MGHKVIEIAGDFTRFPAGRYKADGPFSGERFRDDFLIPALTSHDRVTVRLDGVMGYGSSFLEEVFGGLRRDPRFKAADLSKRIELVSRDGSLVSEIEDYLASSPN
jgi:hypothetical protein